MPQHKITDAVLGYGLRVGGHDHWSELTGYQLRRLARSGDCEAVDALVGDPGSRLVVVALRWVMRGLSPLNAVRKAEVDQAIAGRNEADAQQRERDERSSP